MRVRSTTLKRRLGILAAGAGAGAVWLCAVGGAWGGARHGQAAYPDSIVAMGHSGLTGWNSDPKRREQDAPENSWATGTNPAVNSLYQRILVRNPGIKGHSYNVAQSGSNVDDLVWQARAAVLLPVKPELVVVQSIDNDMRCDGTDPKNYKRFGVTLAKALNIVVKRNPDVQIFFVNVPATSQNYATVARQIPSARAGLIDDGPCGLLEASGKLRQAGIASEEAIIAGYYKQITMVCARLAHCSTDRSALHRMRIQLADLAPDGSHLSIQGHRKMAAVAWKALY